MSEKRRIRNQIRVVEQSLNEQNQQRLGKNGLPILVEYDLRLRKEMTTEGMRIMRKLSEVIDWDSQNPITEENTQKVFDLIETFVMRMLENFGCVDGGSVSLKEGRTSSEMMTELKTYFKWYQMMCESIFKDQSLHRSILDTEFGRWVYYLTDKYLIKVN